MLPITNEVLVHNPIFFVEVSITESLEAEKDTALNFTTLRMMYYYFIPANK